jgi:hypothetical protein
VVLDLNMPIMRGDNLARTFMSRASLGDLPIVFLSGETAAALSTVRSKLPNVKVVSKSDMASALVPALRAAIAERAEHPQTRGWGSQPAALGGPDDAERARFYARLSAEMESARGAWLAPQTGEPRRLLKFAAALRTLEGDANRNELLEVGWVLSAMEEVALAVHQGAKLRPSAESSMQRAIDALAMLARDQNAGAGLKLDAIADALRSAARELRAKRDP